jgi:excisionase family DNA binding protein
MPPPTNAPPDQLAYRVKDAARLLGIGRSTLFELIKENRLPARKVCGATVVLRTDLIAFLERAPRTHGRD